MCHTSLLPWERIQCQSQGSSQELRPLMWFGPNLRFCGSGNSRPGGSVQLANMPQLWELGTLMGCVCVGGGVKWWKIFFRRGGAEGHDFWLMISKGGLGATCRHRVWAFQPNPLHLVLPSLRASWGQIHNYISSDTLHPMTHTSKQFWQ